MFSFVHGWVIFYRVLFIGVVSATPTSITITILFGLLRNRTALFHVTLQILSLLLFCHTVWNDGTFHHLNDLQDLVTPEKTSASNVTRKIRQEFWPDLRHFLLLSSIWMNFFFLDPEGFYDKHQ